MNKYSRYTALHQQVPLLIGTVISHSATGNTSVVELPGGARISVNGQSVPVSQNAFVRDGKIEGAAPNLTALTIEI